MELTAINTLDGLRAALAAPQETQDAVFEREVMEPTRPLWTASLRYFGMSPNEEGVAMRAARAFKFYTPDLGAERAGEALERLERSGVWGACTDALERAAAALRPAEHGVDMEHVSFAFVLADPEGLDPRLDSYTGTGNVPGWLMLLAWPTDFNLPRLPPIVAHEFHHTVRFRVEPGFPMPLGQYLVVEGLAEAFAAELYGEELLGRWTTTLGEPDLVPLKPRYKEALFESDFNVVRGYVFGDWAAAQHGYAPQGVPDFAGYAMGYRLVRTYLERAGRTAAEATYLPWREIVEESRYL